MYDNFFTLSQYVWCVPLFSPIELAEKMMNNFCLNLSFYKTSSRVEFAMTYFQWERIDCHFISTLSCEARWEIWIIFIDFCDRYGHFMASSTNPFIICFYFNRDNAYADTWKKSSRMIRFDIIFGVSAYWEFTCLRSAKKFKFQSSNFIRKTQFGFFCLIGKSLAFGLVLWIILADSVQF